MMKFSVSLSSHSPFLSRAGGRIEGRGGWWKRLIQRGERSDWSIDIVCPRSLRAWGTLQYRNSNYCTGKATWKFYNNNEKATRDISRLISELF